MDETQVLFQPPGFSSKDVITSRGRIRYYESGTGARTLVFLHGFGGGSSSYEWSRIYPAFAYDYRVLALDLPGWGLSEHRSGNYVPEDYRTAIAEFIERTSAEKVTAIASSVVAGLTFWLSVERPELFECIVAVNPSGLRDFGKKYDGSFFSFIENLPLINELVYSQLITTRSSIRDFLRKRLFVRENRITEEMVEAYYTSASQPEGLWAAYSFLKGNLAFDLADWLPKLSIPAAILWGEKSQYEGPDVGRRLAELSPQVRFFETIQDTGLTPQLELPATTIATIHKALALLGTAEPAPAPGTL